MNGCAILAFVDTQFSGGAVNFRSARFSGGEIDFSEVTDWSFPPLFPGQTRRPQA
jgi:hypothetical protein